ncbi:MAG: cyclohydrolase 1 type 2 [Firmicutes bacterium]|nr:cyclohydrolase 1 type 2 [Bacillota bacterium]
MPVKCHELIGQIEKWAPKYLAEEWDNIGLLLGSPAQDIHKIFVTLDVDQEAVQQAVSIGANLIIAHHPLIFKGITNIRTDLPTGALLSDLIKHGIAVYAAHTNLDSAVGGVNDILAQKFNLKDIQPLTTVYQEKLHKLVVFVPNSHVEIVRNAMAKAGAGHIGNYSHCTFVTPGIGSFLPLPSANPFLGESGKLEYVDESRLETIVPEHLRSPVIAAMLAAHPYEEVAYDEYLLLNKHHNYGLGRVGRLAEPVALADFIKQVKGALLIDSLNMAGSPKKLIRQVAVCGGSGASLIGNALKAGADVLVTGDVKYHEAQYAIAEGLAIIDAGHFATELPVVEGIRAYLTEQSQKNGWTVEISVNNLSKDVLASY